MTDFDFEKELDEIINKHTKRVEAVYSKIMSEKDKEIEEYQTRQLDGIKRMKELQQELQEDKDKFNEDKRKILIDYTDALRGYMRESHNNIGFDDRDDEEFVDIFLKEEWDEYIYRIRKTPKRDRKNK